MLARIRRATKELLGMRQWPRREDTRPSSYEEQIYKALIRPSDTCFDVGANDGEVSLFLAKTAGESGLVIAFEPVWPMYCRLCRNLQFDSTLKSPIATVPFGLSDSEKLTTINVPDGLFGMGSLAEASAWANAQGSAEIQSYDVRLTTIDSFLASTGVRSPDFIKIDVEGAELFVLRGAMRMFETGHRPLMLIEVFAPWEQAFGYQPWEMISVLLELGYQFLFACPNGIVDHLPTRLRPFPPAYEMGYNVVAYDSKTHNGRIDCLMPLRAGQSPRLLPMAPPPKPNVIGPTDSFVSVIARSSPA